MLNPLRTKNMLIPIAPPYLSQLIQTVEESGWGFRASAKT
jgi:hypothetical protein